MSFALPTALPLPAQQALATLTQDFRSSLGDALVSLVLFGGAAQGRFDEQRSDLNLLVILATVDPADLDKIAPILARARQQVTVEPMILAEADLADVVEVFATKFQTISRQHTLLHGRDLLSTLSISSERLVRQARRELLNVKLRVRQAYLQQEERPELLGGLIQRGRKTLRFNLDALLLEPALQQSTALREAAAAARSWEEEAPLASACAIFLRQLDLTLRALGPA